MKWLFKYIKNGALIGITILQLFAMPLVLLQYFLNKDYIANNLCENRNNAMLNCKGNCLLSKKLASTKSASEDGENNSTRTIQLSPILVFFESFTTPTAAFVEAKVSYPDFNESCSLKEIHKTVFRPPIA